MSGQQQKDYSIKASLSASEQSILFKQHVKRAVSSYFSSISSLDYELERSTRTFLSKLVNEPEDGVRLIHGAYILDETLLLMDKKLVTKEKGCNFLYENYTHSDLKLIVQLIEKSTNEPYPLDFSDKEGHEELNLNLQQRPIRSLSLEDSSSLVNMLVKIYGYSESVAKGKLPELRQALKEIRSNDTSINTLSNFRLSDKNIYLDLYTDEGLKELLSTVFEISNSVIKEVLPACRKLVLNISEPNEASFLEIKDLFEKNIVDILNGIHLKIDGQQPTEREIMDENKVKNFEGLKGKRAKKGTNVKPLQLQFEQNLIASIKLASKFNGVSQSLFVSQILQEHPQIMSLLDETPAASIEIKEQQPMEGEDMLEGKDFGGVHGKRNPRGTKTTPKQFRLFPNVSDALEKAASQENESTSRFLNNLLENHPVVYKHIKPK